MSKRVRVWYVCDYCGKEVNPEMAAYTDNSGIHNQCYDMCSKECMLKHLEVVKRWMLDHKMEPDISSWIKDHFWINGRGYDVMSHNAKLLFENEIKAVYKYWNGM